MDADSVRLAYDLELAGRAASTRRIYLAAVRDFMKFHGRAPSLMDQPQIREWVEELRTQGLSAQRLRHHLSALKFLYAKTLGRPNAVSFLSFPKDRHRLPTVLAIEDIQRLLRAVTEPKYRAFFAFLYGTGLRLSEGCRVQTGDIDGRRGVLRVRAGKTHKGFTRAASASATFASSAKGSRRGVHLHPCPPRWPGSAPAASAIQAASRQPPNEQRSSTDPRLLWANRRFSASEFNRGGRAV